MNKKIFTIDRKQAEEINNFYHPTATFQVDSYDEVTILDCITKENIRFLPILLKEAFALLKTGGKLIIDYDSSQANLTPDDLEKTLWWLFERSYTIESHNTEKNTAKLTLIKGIESRIENDDITKWSFGMVTNGVRKEFIKKSIQSIRDQKIPHYEIIICGNYPFSIEKDIRYIPFTERDEKGWITRKKNIIAENAKYNNLCIFHDRIIFDGNWFEGMKRYGNNFEILSCPQTLENGQRTGDWVMAGKPYNTPGYAFTIQQLEYKDWDRNVYIGGQFIVLKKHIWKKIPLNETLYWRQAEDIEYSNRLTAGGFLTRLNPYALLKTLSWNFGIVPTKQFTHDGNETLLWKLRDVPVRRITRYISYKLSAFPFVPFVINRAYIQFQRTKFHRFISDH